MNNTVYYVMICCESKEEAEDIAADILLNEYAYERDDIDGAILIVKKKESNE